MVTRPGRIERGLCEEKGVSSITESQGLEEVLVEAEDKEMLRLLRLRTQTGRPLASDRFMSKVETFLGRRVRPLPVTVAGARTRSPGTTIRNVNKR